MKIQLSVQQICALVPLALALKWLTFQYFRTRNNPLADTFWLSRMGGYTRSGSLVLTVAGISRIAWALSKGPAVLAPLLAEVFWPASAGFAIALAFDVLYDMAEKRRANALRFEAEQARGTDPEMSLEVTPEVVRDVTPEVAPNVAPDPQRALIMAIMAEAAVPKKHVIRHAILEPAPAAADATRRDVYAVR